MAKKYMPWEEIVLVSLLGGALALGLAIAGLWMYRWAWDSEELVSMSGGEGNLYAAIAFGIGFVVTAAVLALTTAKKSRARVVSIDQKKWPGSTRFEDRRRNRR